MKSSPRPKTSRLVFGIALALCLVIIPLVLFGLTETVLRVSGYGVSGSLFEKSGMPGMLAMNRDYYALFYPRTEAKTLDPANAYSPVLLENPKPANTFRIFVLGGSTAKGFPFMDRQSFTGIAETLLNAKLEGANRQTRVEVINVAGSAMGSYYVRETARKIWRYEPDLVLVYSGHNEYYGTIGAGTGRGHLSKILYARLKSFRTVQLLYNLMTPARKGTENDSLMAGQLASGVFPQNEKTDRIVAERFIDNLDAVRRGAERRKIPLVVMDPVSNYLGMPPFDGEESAGFAEMIARGKKAAAAGGDAAREWLAEADREPGTERNAHILYLKALIRAKEGKIDRKAFLAAKDADTLPFRARETVRDALVKWAGSHPETVTFIPLERELFAVGREASATDFYFIDHLHFNFRGQMVVGRITADYVAKAAGKKLGVEPGNWPEPGEISKAIHYHPALDLYMLMTMNSLLQNKPYSGMLVPYDGFAVREGLVQNAYLQDEKLRAELTAHQDQVLPIVTQYLQENGRYQELAELLNSMVFVNPGSYGPSYNLAQFLDSVGVTDPGVLHNYERAWLLSGKKAGILADMSRYAEKAGYTAPLAEFLAANGAH